MSVARPLRERLRLVVLTDRQRVAPRSVESVVEAILVAGCPCIQLRDKDAPARELLATAERLRRLTLRQGALLIVNDRLDVALASGADGVHLGPDDLPVDRVRSIVPPGFLVGYSTDDPAEARRAVRQGADYLGCGTVWATASKADAGHPIGPQGVERVARAVPVPVVAIGGIDVDGARLLSGGPAAGVAVLGSVMGAPEPGARVREFLAALGGA